MSTKKNIYVGLLNSKIDARIDMLIEEGGNYRWQLQECKLKS